MLTYAATGNPPFGGDNPASVLFRIVSAEPDLTSVPPRLRQVIEACLKKDPAQRPEPAQVIAMISALGPESPATLGSFWPEDVAQVIAAEGAASPPPVKRTPTALATPVPGQGGSPTGHAPMLSDGYYAAAAQGRSAPASVPAPASAPAQASPSAPLLSSPPQAYATPQTPPAAQESYGQTVFGQPGLGQSGLATPAAYPAQPAPYAGQGGSYPGQGGSYPGQGGSYPGQGGSYPGQQDALAQYAPGRRKPTAAEVPGNVHTAIRLMYIGFVITALNVVLSLLVLGRYTHDANTAKNAAATYTTIREFGRAAAQTAVMHNQNTMAGAMTIGLVAAVLGLACWAWLAVATRRGNGWTRVAGTALLAVYSICTLIVVFGTHRDPGPQFTTVLVWAIGVAAVIPLWSQQARDFFYAWRKR